MIKHQPGSLVRFVKSCINRICPWNLQFEQFEVSAEHWTVFWALLSFTDKLFTFSILILTVRQGLMEMACFWNNGWSKNRFCVSDGSHPRLLFVQYFQRTIIHIRYLLMCIWVGFQFRCTEVYPFSLQCVAVMSNEFYAQPPLHWIELDILKRLYKTYIELSIEFAMYF
jgi:hypothetical protein